MGVRPAPSKPSDGEGGTVLLQKEKWGAVSGIRDINAEQPYSRCPRRLFSGEIQRGGGMGDARPFLLHLSPPSS